ncbi:MAG TPA: winged helix-turn-helix domain-containing protein, partial [Terriglobales bacterium]|nr:winged helix-turn-helix domain-containing protein [Terriglobales bacterium]
MPVSRPIRGFCFGPFELDSDTGELRNNGTPLHLQPQPLQVLTILLQSPGKLVTREQLQQQLWPQDTFVEFEVGLNQAIKKLRETLGDSAQSPIYIETVPRRGYRFIAPVEEILPAEFPAEQTTDRTNISTPQSDTWILILYKKSSIIIIATLAFIVAVTGDLAYRHYRRTQFAGRPVAITSFRDLTQDPQLEWLGPGMAEMLTTNLGQVQGIDLISPERLVRAEQELNKRKPRPTPSELAREVGATLLVTGSVMKVSPSKIVVEVRMQEVGNGRIVFTETMQGEDVASIFQMTNSTTERLSKELLPRKEVPDRPLQIEQSLTSNIEALRHYQAAVSYGRRMLNDKAIRELEEAVHLDPQFAAAYLALFGKYRSVGDAGKALEHLRSAERFQDRLPQLAKLEIEASKVTLSGDIRELIRVREEMLRRDPRNVENRNELAGAYIMDRQPQRAVSIMQDAMSLDPKDSFLVSQHPYDFGWAGDEAGAIEACRKYAALVGSDEPDPWSAFGDMYYLFGRTKEAANAYRELLEIDPTYSRYDAFKSLAIIYADGGEPQQAEQMLQEYRKHVSGVWQIDAAAFEAQLHQLRGDPEGSLTIYQRLVPALID